MCFICSQSNGFETDIATIIKSCEKPTLKVNQTNRSIDCYLQTNLNKNDLYHLALSIIKGYKPEVE